MIALKRRQADRGSCFIASLLKTVDLLMPLAVQCSSLVQWLPLVVQVLSLIDSTAVVPRQFRKL
jgi:hypothetical protein